MANTVYHAAETRGKTKIGWLDSNHTFSFGSYQNNQRIHFGVLRVLNDDVIAGGSGFAAHPHSDMEIISIPLSGSLKHKDNMGNEVVIKTGDIQVMSAGTGIQHSEYNASSTEPCSFLQIWIFPHQKSVKPRYDLFSYDTDLENQWQQLLSPNQEDKGVWIHQNAWIHLGKMSEGIQLNYALKNPKNGLYIFVLNGTVKIYDQILNPRDGFGITDPDHVEIEAVQNAEIIVMELPMHI
ncbi:MAG: pirin family protein [Saprospiraceae bacterium]|nr:pirin family protein [Saprospiraceae bacterium]